MTKSEKKKLIATNAAILALGMVASFVLPLVMESVMDGRADFLKMMVHIVSLIIAMMASTGVISKAFRPELQDQTLIRQLVSRKEVKHNVSKLYVSRLGEGIDCSNKIRPCKLSPA